MTYDQPLFKNDIVFGSDDYFWKIEDDFSYDKSATMVLNGGALRYNERRRMHTIYHRFDQFVDDEHDHCYSASLDIVNLVPIYSYGAMFLEGLVISGSWYTEPINNIADLLDQVPTGRGDRVEECSDDVGKCYYGRTNLGVHYMGVPYSPPVQKFEPTQVRLTYGPVKGEV